MRYLIIPDVHDKIAAAQRAMDGVPHDKRIFHGDFFDDWGTGTRQAAATARWLRPWLHDPDTDVLWGNHDLSYRRPRQHACSGFTQEKWLAICAHLSSDDWAKFKLHVWLPGPRRPWLLTHAGFDHHFLADGEDLRETVDRKCAAALRSIHDDDRKSHSILGVGSDRGGRQHKGGVTWCDWYDLRPPPGADQIVGHTFGKEPKVEEFPECVAVCLDTGLRHVGLLEDGFLSVIDVPKIRRSRRKT